MFAGIAITLYGWPIALPYSADANDVHDDSHRYL